ncbi:MAG: methionine ABC transporter permease [Ruminococcus sp.]
MFESIVKLKDEIIEALAQTGYMVIISLIVAVIAGGFLGILLYAASSQFFFKNEILKKSIGFVLNIIRSVPFLILMILLLPLSKLVVGTKIGPEAVIVPLSIASTAFFARLAEASFSDVNSGIIEAAFSSGASKSRIIFGIIIPEALPSLVKNITVTAISVLGFSAMAGLVGGGGLGDLAYRYGYQRYQTDIMLVCVIMLIVIVQLIQWIGDYIAYRLDKKH